MSVILTASKKAVKPKSGKPKKKRPAHRANGASTSNTPPMSSERTKVWHWELEGDPITVMYNKDKNEVWCNGEVMDTMNSFSHDGDGGVIEFYIITDDGNVHNGRIKRIATGDRKEPILYQLFVNGYMIMEHNATSPYSGIEHLTPYEHPGLAYEASGSSYDMPPPMGGPYALAASPPPYYDEIEEEEKKEK